jgi:hypothetical protein
MNRTDRRGITCRNILVKEQCMEVCIPPSGQLCNRTQMAEEL